MLSDDPDFEDKAADMIGLYLEPPQHAAVFASMRRPRFRRSIAWTRSCRCRRDGRNGTGLSITVMARLSLYAALNTTTGEIMGRRSAPHQRGVHRLPNRLVRRNRAARDSRDRR